MNNEKIITFEIPKGYMLKESHPDKLVYERIDQPTSLAEACNVINIKNYYAYRYSLLEALQRLLIFRDAWWKMAGDWKPDYRATKFSISVRRGEIDTKHTQYTRNYILVFPTIEMRDAFYENFKDLIEICKELL